VTSAMDRALDGLIVSWPAGHRRPAGNSLEIVVGFALAAESGQGAIALRIEGVANVRAVRAATALPIIGLVKRTEPGTAVFITPLLADIADLVDAGADIIAFDATAAAPPGGGSALIRAIHAAGTDIHGPTVPASPTPAPAVDAGAASDRHHAIGATRVAGAT